MNPVIKTTFFAAAILAGTQSHALAQQDPTLGQKISKTATNVGHKTSEIAAKGAAAVVDKKYEGKTAPGGQTVYINEKSRYYYINKLGHRVYLKKSELKDKPSD
jgi:hypothetical protein